MPSYGTLDEHFGGTNLSSKFVSGRKVSRKHWVTITVLCCVAVEFMLVSQRSVSITGDPQAPVAASDVAALGVNTDSVRKAAPRSNSPNFMPAGDDEDPLSFHLTNFYHERDGKPAQDYPWLQDVKLAEPYRNTTALVENPRDGHDYLWIVRSEEQQSGDSNEDSRVLATAKGAKTTVVFTHLDKNWLVLEEFRTADGVAVRRVEELVMVKYVRREIRTLTESDRNELLDGVSAMMWC